MPLRQLRDFIAVGEESGLGEGGAPATPQEPGVRIQELGEGTRVRHVYAERHEVRWALGTDRNLSDRWD
jgi:hypothetical protein